MPITYQIDHAAALIRTTCSGDIDIDDVRDHFRTLLNDPGRPNHLDVFLDLRELAATPSAEDIREAGNTIARLPSSLSFGACAIVAQRDALYGMSRMFSVFVEQFFRVICAFRSAAEAEKWLDAQRAEASVTSAASSHGSGAPSS